MFISTSWHVFFPDCGKPNYFIYLFYLFLLSLLSTVLRQFLLLFLWYWWSCSLPYIHVWWVCTIPGVGIWFTLGVIQALITRFASSRPVLNSSTSATELFTLLQSDSTTILKLSAIAVRTPLRRMIYPLVNYQNESKQILNYLDERPSYSGV